jgi:signal transduction histidine kinase
VIFFTIYTKKLYPEDTSNVFAVSGVWLCSLLTLIVIFFPPSVFTQLINPFLLYMFGFIGYAFFVYIKAWRNNRIGAKYATMSTAVILVVFLLINLQYFRLLAPQKAFLFAGYISFFFLQSLVLSFRFAHTLKLAKQQAEEGLQAKNEFLSTMSHEIRTPLNSVLGMTHLILRNNPSPSQKEQLDVLLFSANNLLAIVNDILDYNKIEAGKVHFELIEMDLNSLAKNIITGLRSTAEDKGIQLDMQIDPALQDKILGDPMRIGQIITNLVNNAIKFTPKGRVLLAIKVDAQTNTNITLSVRVEDTGIGIAPEKQKLIFEEFTQADTSTSRHFGGTGLGLAICKKLLSLQGSSLQLSSEPGKGSIFYFTQSFTKISNSAEQIVSTTDKLPSEDSKPLTGISILLVEDNEINILVAKTFLERWGATIDVATNGQEALDMIDEKKHRMVLMDLHMPVMDGYEATRIIRERGLKIPIIALTASLPREVETRVKETGVNDIIVKPFVPDELYRMVLHFTGVRHSNK